MRRAVLITLIAAPAFLAVVGKLVMPQRRMLIAGRAALFLIVTLALGPGVLTNGILKEHSGAHAADRRRPARRQGALHAVVGSARPCPDNCSFVAGEASGAFWTLAPAALAPPQWRALAYGAAIVFGVAMGVLRMAAGAHFFTDVVFAGVLHVPSDLDLPRPDLSLAGDPDHRRDGRAPARTGGQAMRDALAALARRVSGRKRQRLNRP